MFLSAVLAAAVLMDGLIPESGSFHGEAAIESLSDGGAIVYVDTNADASFDHVFRLNVAHTPRDVIQAERRIDPDIEWPAPSILTPGPSYFRNANVEYANGYVRVFAAGEALELFVEGTQSAQWNPSGARVWRYAGYGLVHEVRETGIPIRSPGRKGSITSEFCDASTDCNPGETDDGGGGGGGGTTTLCDAGGPGSTSCSVSSNGRMCTATCGTGFYACCMYGNPNKCRCIAG